MECHNYAKLVNEKLYMKNLNIAIIGLGYVGLPLALEFSKYFNTLGFDVSKKRVKELNLFYDVTNQFKKNKIKNSKIKFTDDQILLQKYNIFIICVPTPVSNKNLPDLHNLKSATKIVSKYVKKNDIIIYESTVYPGTTEDVCVPIIEKKSKLKLNKGFFVGYSPERINPGDKKHTITKIKKVISASNTNTLNKINFIYSKIISAGVYKTKSIKIAEAAKVIENTQRDINIAFMNELSIIFEKMSINTNEVIKAASTKWNFLKFKPGLVGGHCIGVDPYYLAYASKKSGYNSNFILSGRSINQKSYLRILKKIKNYTSQSQNNKFFNCLVCGLTFKEDCPDIRNSQAIKIIDSLYKSKKIRINLFDPVVNVKDLPKKYKKNFVKLNNTVKYDIILLLVKHKSIINSKNKIFKKIKKDSLVVDLHNIIEYKNIKNKCEEYYSF